MNCDILLLYCADEANHEWTRIDTKAFTPKAFGALECGPPQDGFALANLTPLSGAGLLGEKFLRHLAYLADE